MTTPLTIEKDVTPEHLEEIRNVRNSLAVCEWDRRELEDELNFRENEIKLNLVLRSITCH